MKVAGRAVQGVGRTRVRVSQVKAKVGFPYLAPTTPKGVEKPKEPKKVGADFPTEWARRPPARAARAVLMEGPLRLAVRVVASPDVVGLDRLADLRRRAEEAGDRGERLPVIFAANHHSHLDTPVLLTSIPLPWRRQIVVGAAADYFFGTRLTGAMSALALGAFPIERTKVNRRSADLAKDLIDDGWSLIIFPEGGRSPDGWGQPFRGGAAFLAIRCGVPVVPVHLEGTGELFGKGMKRPRAGTSKVTFGAPLFAEDGDDARSLNSRIEAAVAALGDEVLDGWWAARHRAHRGESRSLSGPDADGWRRSWALTDRRARGRQGVRRRQQRRWPDLG